MERNIYKIKVWMETDDIGVHWVDTYFDVNEIFGFFIPAKREGLGEVDEAINILVNGDTITIKQEPHIVDYLTHMFVNRAVTKLSRKK